jgi:hypothetical protein
MSMVMERALQPVNIPPQPYVYPWTIQPITIPPLISPEAIKVLEKIMWKAKEYDRMTGQPDCEIDEKKEALQKIADGLGVKINFP